MPQATDSSQVKKEAVLTVHATGTFEVKINPEGPADKFDAPLGRFLIDKQFHGDLEAI